MVCYNSHKLLMVLLAFLSRSSIEEDTTFSFSLCTQKSEVYY